MAARRGIRALMAPMAVTAARVAQVVPVVWRVSVAVRLVHRVPRAQMVMAAMAVMPVSVVLVGMALTATPGPWTVVPAALVVPRVSGVQPDPVPEVCPAQMPMVAPAVPAVTDSLLPQRVLLAATVAMAVPAAGHRARVPAVRVVSAVPVQRVTPVRPALTARVPAEKMAPRAATAAPVALVVARAMKTAVVAQVV